MAGQRVSGFDSLSGAHTFQAHLLRQTIRENSHNRPSSETQETHRQILIILNNPLALKR